MRVVGGGGGAWAPRPVILRQTKNVNPIAKHLLTCHVFYGDPDPDPDQNEQYFFAEGGLPELLGSSTVYKSEIHVKEITVKHITNIQVCFPPPLCERNTPSNYMIESCGFNN
jgi:hypothetical protein